MQAAPDRSEAAEYYFRYIDQVPAGDICALIDAQGTEFLALLNAIPEDRTRHRYAAGKWSIREVVNHVSDTERLFGFRAFWFARGFESPLPSFDQAVAVSAAAAEDRSWPGLVEEFATVRAASSVFFRSLPPTAWTRRGIASDNPFSVRALAYLVVGHVIHHTRMLQERYLAS